MPTALIVDDEPEGNKLLSMLVQYRGYQTTSAFTGEEALAQIDRDPPDVVLLDLMLPDISGFHVCEAVKARKDTTLIPVVMVTARVAAENREESYARGADHYVAKPYTPDQIFDVLDDTKHWRKRVLDLDCTAGGEILIISNDEDEIHRTLGRLRSVLFARTPLDIDSVKGLEESLRMFVNDAQSWGKRHRVSPVASLSYVVKSDSVVLTLTDLSGWIRDDPRTPIDRRPGGLALSGLVAVEERREEGIVTLVKRFRK